MKKQAKCPKHIYCGENNRNIFNKVIVKSVSDKTIKDIISGKKVLLSHSMPKSSYAGFVEGWVYLLCYTPGAVLENFVGFPENTPIEGKIVLRFWYDSDNVDVIVKASAFDLLTKKKLSPFEPEEDSLLILEGSILPNDEKKSASQHTPLKVAKEEYFSRQLHQTKEEVLECMGQRTMIRGWRMHDVEIFTPQKFLDIEDFYVPVEPFCNAKDIIYHNANLTRNLYGKDYYELYQGYDKITSWPGNWRYAYTMLP